MRNKRFIVLIAILFVGTDALAEVVDAEAGGFTSVNEATIDAPRDAVWRAAIAEINQWWSSEHTISGEASRLRIEARPLGCFCEDLGEGAGVVHMTVTTHSPAAMLRLTGGLGPLGLMGVEGNMTWEFSDTDDGTWIRFTYAVGGYHPGGLDSLAAPVDGVIGEALERLKAYVETGDAEPSAID
ncbi:MAG: SRPBCC family protein [Gammaproteobacteria bacterium]|nr:SRPBCC family protein [Gammaproteobacteria bacterium]MBT8110834.1 SRPBCC family protein [Gammaproteobacteria bacterium]NNL45533.1 ATPase [Woeseiaceae bacterium]